MPAVDFPTMEAHVRQSTSSETLSVPNRSGQELPTGRPSQRRSLARACLDYVHGRGVSEGHAIPRAWRGERLFQKQATLNDEELGDTSGADTGPSALTLDGVDGQFLRHSLKLRTESLSRFHTWAREHLPKHFRVLYVSEGGTPSERRQATLKAIQEMTQGHSDTQEGFVLCGSIDDEVYKRLRPFGPIPLMHIAEDSGFTLEELTYLTAHECQELRCLGDDDFSALLTLLRGEPRRATLVSSWEGARGVSEDERRKRCELARRCLQAGAGHRVEELLADRSLGHEADLYLALGYLQTSEWSAAEFYYNRLKSSSFTVPSNMKSLIETQLMSRSNPERRSFALNSLDLKLRTYLGEKPGIFIEAGGNDGISQSNTLYFERYHQWRGILIEGIPDLASKCLTNRPRAWVENCALVPFGFCDPTISMTYCNLMSVVEGAMKTAEEEAEHIATGEKVQQLERYRVDVRTKTLSAVIESYGAPKIDLLSLDVEGFELQVLQGLDLERHAPTWMLIEARYREEIDAYLRAHYEVVDELSHHDVLYRRRGA